MEEVAHWLGRERELLPRNAFADASLQRTQAAGLPNIHCAGQTTP
jgi:hypothetical protein